LIKFTSLIQQVNDIFDTLTSESNSKDQDQNFSEDHFKIQNNESKLNEHKKYRKCLPWILGVMEETINEIRQILRTKNDSKLEKLFEDKCNIQLSHIKSIMLQQNSILKKN
jgi:hypothetical protein